MMEAQAGFRRLKAHRQLSVLRRVLTEHRSRNSEKHGIRVSQVPKTVTVLRRCKQYVFGNQSL